MKLRPLGDRIVLKYQEMEGKTESGIILPDSAKEKQQKAIVVAVGSGKCDSGENYVMQIKEGDYVIFSKYAGTDVRVEDEDYIIVSQKDIMAVVE